MDFIFMLTRGDETVTNCLDLLDAIRPLGLRHIGFKDVGVPAQTLKVLTAGIRAMGATSYLEVVSTSDEACLQSAHMGRELQVDRLLGGSDVPAIMDILRGSRTDYYPFAGRPYDHPTKLAGTPAEIEAQCRLFRASGCVGADLLAYRSTEAEPLDLVKAARRGLGNGYLIVAGSVSSAAKIRAVGEAGADAFTIGSALFDGAYSAGPLVSQLRDVLNDCRSITERRASA